MLPAVIYCSCSGNGKSQWLHVDNIMTALVKCLSLMTAQHLPHPASRHSNARWHCQSWHFIRLNRPPRDHYWCSLVYRSGQHKPQFQKKKMVKIMEAPTTPFCSDDLPCGVKIFLTPQGNAAWQILWGLRVWTLNLDPSQERYCDENPILATRKPKLVSENPISPE